MKIEEAIELLNELKDNEDGSHYAKAIEAVLKELERLESLYDSACEELSAEY